MRNNKGQAALEFMMTYGWAILVVLAAIGALSYFGILDPSRFTPNTCLASSGFSCDGKPIGTPNNITFTLSNGLGFDVNLSNTKVALSNLQSCDPANVSVCSRGSICTNSDDQLVVDGGSATIVVHDCDFTGLNIVKGDVTFTYTNAKSALPETVKVSVVAKPK